MINPADASQIVHRRSYSSDMSSDGGVVKGKISSLEAQDGETVTKRIITDIVL